VLVYRSDLYKVATIARIHGRYTPTSLCHFSSRANTIKSGRASIPNSALSHCKTLERVRAVSAATAALRIRMRMRIRISNCSASHSHSALNNLSALTFRIRISNCSASHSHRHSQSVCLIVCNNLRALTAIKYFRSASCPEKVNEPFCLPVTQLCASKYNLCKSPSAACTESRT
jgi:hypothetical protein